VSKSKHRPGKSLSLSEAITAIENKQFIYVRGKVYHHGWSQNWRLRELIRNVKKGWVNEAVQNTETMEAGNAE